MSSLRALAAAVYGHIRIGPMTGGAKRGLLYLVLTGIMINGGALALGARAVTITRRTETGLHGQLLADCRFFRDIGNLAAAPVTIVPATGKPSRAGIVIFADGRSAWRGHDCPGTLLAPSASYARWAAYFHVPAR